MHTKSVGKPEGKRLSEDLVTDGKILLKYTLKKQDLPDSG
jgi:hypothetical protein